MLPKMKKLPLLIFLAALGYTANAQVRPLNERKTKDYMEDRTNGSTRVTAVRVLNEEHSNPVLVVVDDKIYDPDAEAFKRIPATSIELLRTIQDSSSTTPVKRILIYRRK